MDDNIIENKSKMYIAGVYHPASEIIPDVLATWGAGDEGWDYMEDRYTLIQEKELEVSGAKWPVVDCRDMEDGPGNPLWMYEKKIDAACYKIEQYGKVIVCCLAGVSRSNSIAAGVLMKKYKMDYIDAIGEVRDKIPYADMDQAHLNALKKLFPSEFPFNYGKVNKKHV
jgi:protein-tyrosine phosphatase